MGKYGSNKVLDAVAICSDSQGRLEVFDKRIGHVGAIIVGDAGGGAFNVLHQAVEIIAGRGNADYANGGAIPEFGGVEFRDRNVERVAQFIFQAAHDLATVFDGLGRFNVKFEGERSDGHMFSNVIPLTSPSSITAYNLPLPLAF